MFRVYLTQYKLTKESCLCKEEIHVVVEGQDA